MRKIWKLYIIFVFFFVAGDLLTTFAILDVKQQVRAGEREPAVPEECQIKLPAHCDRSSVPALIEDNVELKLILIKLVVAAGVLVLVFSDMRILLLGLTVFMVTVTGNNLSILLYDLRSFFIYFEAITIYYIVRYFTRWREE
jgi:hypothetical protein|tara:strand:+ start:547 stop:972 length:426 start_codon:yes stop_codon:yes gene_type:complete